MRGRRFAVRTSRDWLPVLCVALFFGFFWFWWGWMAQTSTVEGGWIIAYITWPAIIFVSLIALAIAAIINVFRPEKRISLSRTFFITYVSLNLWAVFWWITM